MPRDTFSAALESLRGQNASLDEMLNIVSKMYTIKTQVQANVDMHFVTSYPPGHFYSPLPDREEVERVALRIYGDPPPDTLPGIHLQEARQLELVERLSKYYKNLPYADHKRDNWRYYYRNPAFSYADAIWLYSMLREFTPGRIIEVGSGFSSCVMLDTAEKFLRSQPEMIFIDPYPQRLYDAMGASIPVFVRVMPQEVQSVPLEIFETLEDGDILFLDSSHVGKIGSDLLHLLFAVLPRLKRGVLVHFHDIFYPFEYPLDWVKGGCAWNENYFIRAFLQYNDAFEILLFGDFLGKKHPALLRKFTPLCLKNTGGSLWLRKNK